MSVAVYQQVVNAVSERVAEAFTEMPVYTRRRPYLLEEDRVPCCIVCPDRNGERILFETFGGNVVYAYPVAVMIVNPGNEHATLRYPTAMDEESDRETFDHTEMRQIVRNAIYKTSLDGVDSVFNGEIQTGPPFIQSGGNGQSLYLASFVTVTHWSLESQTW